MEQAPPPPPAGPQEPAKKKGLHPMAWVGIGCGGLLVIAVVAISLLVGMCKRKVGEFQESMAANPQKTAAEMVVKMNPDLEMVSDDETTGEMTVRVKSSGEEITVSYADLAEGRLTVTDGEGTTTTLGSADESEIPAWVPRYPAIAEQKSVFHQDGADGVQGVWVFSTNDTPDQVQEFFDTETSWSTSSGGGSTSINGATQLNRDYGGAGRTLKLIVGSRGTGQPTQVTVNYQEPKP